MNDASDYEFQPRIELVPHEPVAPLTAEMLDDAPPPRAAFEAGMSYLPRVTIALIVINLVIFVAQAATGVLGDQQGMMNAGALEQQAVFRGEVWRLASSVFLHANASHVIGNCIVLFIVGMACEHAFGLRRTLGIYLLSGITGSLMSVAFERGPTVGASGAIFGVLGCVTVFLYRYRRQLALRDGRIAFVLAAWAVYQIGTGFLSPFVANFAHLGGLLGGLITGLLWRPVLIAPPPEPEVLARFESINSVRN